MKTCFPHQVNTHIAHPLSVWWKKHYVAMAFSLVWELQEFFDLPTENSPKKGSFISNDFKLTGHRVCQSFKAGNESSVFGVTFLKDLMSCIFLSGGSRCACLIRGQNSLFLLRALCWINMRSSSLAASSLMAKPVREERTWAVVLHMRLSSFMSHPPMGETLYAKKWCVILVDSLFVKCSPIPV